jgi:uncharacterized protein (DUF488 family)
VNTVYTIGYEGTNIKNFVATLIAAKVRILEDVRAVSFSRKPGFSKKSLQKALLEADIEYRHYADLGDPKEGRLAARAGKIDEFKRIFTSHLTGDEAQRALSDLVDSVKTSATCLMCFERDPRGCHRSIIATHMASHGISVFDLYGDSPDRYVRNSKLLPSNNSHQGSAARQ